MCCLSASGSPLRTHRLLLLAHGIFSFPRLAGSITHAPRVTGLPLLCFSSSCIISHIPSKIILRSKSQGRNQLPFPPVSISAFLKHEHTFLVQVWGFYASTNWWKYLREVKQLCNNQGCSETQWWSSQCFLLGSVSAAPNVPRHKHRFPSLHFYYSVGVCSGATCREDALRGYNSFSEPKSCF